MINFKKFLIINEVKSKEEVLTDFISRLEKLEFVVKIKGGKVFAYTKNNRYDSMKKIAKVFKRDGAEIVKPITKAIRNISSIGYVRLSNGLIIVVKPITKNRKEAEEKASNDLDKLIKRAVKENNGPVEIKIGPFKIKNVVEASSKHISGDPKADITLIDDKRKEVGFISHKKEGGSSAFQQYSGLSKDSGIDIYNSSIVNGFVIDIDSYLKENFNTNIATEGMSFKREVPNDADGQKIVGKSVYGFSWVKGGKSFGRNFVHCLGQGDPVLKQKGEIYDLNFSDTMHTADNIDWAFEGDYKAYLAATFRVGRRLENKGIEVENLRGGIYPEGFISGRNAIEL